jgi:eukaryotic-like serine/threonine-protein kinase
VQIVECDPRTVRLYLDGDLNENDEARLIDHLAQCGECRALMRELAGSEEDWFMAKELLLSGPEAYSSEVQGCSPHVNNLAMDLARYVQLHPTDDPHRMGRIGSFEVMSVIGRGGMGIVFKAFDPALHRTVAIKVLDPMVARLESSRRRFARESRAMAAIVHEHIVPVYAVDEHRELPYIVMEYVPGGTLESRLANGTPMNAIEIVRTVLQIAQGLAAAHRVGVIHRDIKPSNILLDTGTERIRVADFGLAHELNAGKQTHSQSVIGTPLFMSPEQVRGELCDARSDLFSLGALMYNLCTGQSPFQAEQVYATLQKITSESPPIPLSAYRNDLPDWMDAMVNRLLQKDRGDRFQTAEELCEALEQELAALQSPATCEAPKRAWLHRAGNPYTSGRWRLGLAVVAIVAICLLTVSINALVNGVPNNPGQVPLTNAGPPDPANQLAIPLDEISDDPDVAKWVKLLVEAQGHNMIAFNLGPKMLAEEPDKATRIAETAWPRLRDRQQKSAILKVFRFASHDQVLNILHLGMTDDDPDIRKYADAYLIDYSFRSFDGEPEAYLKWRSGREDKSASELFEEYYRLLSIELQRVGPNKGLEKWSQRKEKLSSPKQKPEAIAQSGLSELFVKWIDESKITKDQRLMLLEFFREVPLESTKAQRLFATMATSSPDFELRLAAVQAIIASNPSQTYELLSSYIDEAAKAKTLPLTNNRIWNLATTISNTGDARFIPILIGLIESDNTYNTVYGVGYYGLGFSELGKLTQVKYSPFHDGLWWRNWWKRNEARFSDEAKSIPIPVYPKTAAGAKIQPIEEDIETHEGRMALAEKLIRRKKFDQAGDIAELFVLHQDREAIPLLIGIIEADNSYDTVYGVGYFGLQKLVEPLKVRYSPYHDGAWWRRWWERNKSNFSESVQAQAIPVFNKSKFGETYVELPADLDTHAGRLDYVRNTLAQGNPDLRKLCELLELDSDPRDFAIFIGMIALWDGKPELKVALDSLVIPRMLLGRESMPKSFQGWQEWWLEHRSDWPETKTLDIYDLSKFASKASSATIPNASLSRPVDVDQPQAAPSQLITVPTQPRMQYLLIGKNLEGVSVEQRKLVVVLPGGDGSREFEGFVRRIWENAMDETWIVAQPIAVKWFPDQDIVWPTQPDTNAYYSNKPIDFCTEVFIDHVIDDICKRTPIDPSKTIVLGWSSSGPAVYSYSLSSSRKATRAYIAMSVFHPDRLPELTNANEIRYVIDHSRQDRVCPFRFAQQARSQLKEAGAIVKAIDYQGGHGWLDDPYQRLKSGLSWLVHSQP